MYCVIKSTINEKNLSDIDHEVIDINPSKYESIDFFENYVKDVPKKYKIKRTGNKIVYNEPNYIVTVQIHEHKDKQTNIDTNFIDDSCDSIDGNDVNNMVDVVVNDDDDVVNTDDIEQFLNFQPNMSVEEKNSYMDRVNIISNKSKKDCVKIKSKYDRIIKKNNELMELLNNEKELTLKF
jgi:hypothetical protein